MSAVTLEERPVRFEGRRGASAPAAHMPLGGDAPAWTALPDDVCIDGRDVDGCIYCTGPETD